MDGHRTGCKTPSKENVKETVGYFNGKTYVAPNGKRFPAGTATAKVAGIVLDGQPARSSAPRPAPVPAGTGDAGRNYAPDPW